MWIRAPRKHWSSLILLFPGYENVLSSNSRSWMQWFRGWILELELVFNADYTIYNLYNLSLNFVAWKIRIKYRYLVNLFWRLRDLTSAKELAHHMGKKEPVCNWKSITRVATVVGQEMKGK